jgi:RNA polymerase-binding transcription factor DksA
MLYGVADLLGGTRGCAVGPSVALLRSPFYCFVRFSLFCCCSCRADSSARARRCQRQAAGRAILLTANADAEAELQILLHESDGCLLITIEEALARMRQGTYGVCAVCKEPITKARLEAVPWTHLCRECKERQAA